MDIPIAYKLEINENPILEYYFTKYTRQLFRNHCYDRFSPQKITLNLQLYQNQCARYTYFKIDLTLFIINIQLLSYYPVLIKHLKQHA